MMNTIGHSHVTATKTDTRQLLSECKLQFLLLLMEIINMSQIIIFNKLEERRRGRPRKRWKEEAERDLQVLGVRKMERVGGR